MLSQIDVKRGNTLPYCCSHSAFTSSSRSFTQELPDSSAGLKQFLSRTHRETSGALTMVRGFGLEVRSLTQETYKDSSFGSSRACFFIKALLDTFWNDTPIT